MECSILDSIPDLASYKSFTERYFTKRYIINVNGLENNDMMVMFHSNRIALLSLAPSHKFFKMDGDYKINYTIGKLDRLRNSVKGKSKKGGQLLTPVCTVCKIEFNDGLTLNIPCCMKGTLVEVNDELVENPKLLKDCPDSDGFIAIILSSIAISEATKNELLTHEEYIKLRESAK